MDQWRLGVAMMKTFLMLLAYVALYALFNYLTSLIPATWEVNLTGVLNVLQFIGLCTVIYVVIQAG
jgi:hypothetical protein